MSGFGDAVPSAAPTAPAAPAAATIRVGPVPSAFALAFAVACGRTSSGHVATAAARPMPSTPNSANP
jgi:hypothetical protein